MSEPAFGFQYRHSRQSDDTGPGLGDAARHLGVLRRDADRTTVSTLLDHLTFQRGVEVFLNTVHVAPLEAVRIGLGEIGASAANQVRSISTSGPRRWGKTRLELDPDGPGPGLVHPPPALRTPRAVVRAELASR